MLHADQDCAGAGQRGSDERCWQAQSLIGRGWQIRRLTAGLAMVALILVTVAGAAAGGSEPPDGVATTETPHLPFPANRVRDFYFRQAEQWLDARQPVPDLLPQFPGLDGGAFGHWGQNPPERSIDNTLNSVDSGNVICNRIIHFGKQTPKGVAVLLSSGANGFSTVFDPSALSFTDLWQGGFVVRGSSRFGVHDGARAHGQQVGRLSVGHWVTKGAAETRYRGFYRHRQHVVFSYRIGSATILDHVQTLNGNAVVRTIDISGPLPKGTMLNVAQRAPDVVVRAIRDGDNALRVSNDLMYITFASADHQRLHIVISADKAASDKAVHAVQNNQLSDIAALVRPASGQWTEKTTQTTAETTADGGAFAIDTLTVPYAAQNAFGTPMRLTGVATVDEQTMAVCTLLGDVWLVKGIDRELSALTWQRIAAGLYLPLGLVVQQGKIIVLGADQVTRLHDTNGDHETDFYECVTNEYPTTGGHDFATSLQQDKDGRLYWATASHDFGLTRLTPGGKPESLGNGLRNSNGIGVSADGKITLATVQEGSWTPATAIFDVHDHSFHGHGGPRAEHGSFGYDLPQCFIPRGVDNSAGEICFLPQDQRLGPLSGRVLGSSYGYCSLYLVLREQIGQTVQGGVVPLPGEFLSGVCRITHNPHDGCVYVAGTEGWQSYASEKGCLQRLRFTGRQMPLLTRVQTCSNGLLLHFNAAIDPASATVDNVFCQQWNYLYSAAYGSPEYSVRQEGRQGHDYVPVQSVHLRPDGRSVFLHIPQLHPVMQFHVHARFKTTDDQAFVPDAYLTIYDMGAAITDFEGYQHIAKRSWPAFPKAERFEQDPRLVAQDRFGTNVSWVRDARKLTLKAVVGLKYDKTRLRVAPGAKVALTFQNTDPGMPHNVVVVHEDRVDEFGQKAMMLASNPKAIATHYVPDDPAEICFSPILNPGDQYTVYFEAPRQPGRYRFLCTYPGHWRVMQGSLYVLPDDRPLPPPAPDELSRSFVRRWTVEDLAVDAEQVDVPDTDAVQRGQTVFTDAGCIRCHRFRGQGSTLGPDLTDVTKRFRRTALLRQILEPSAEINKQFQTWIVATTAGKVHAGLLQNQTPSAVTLLPDPLHPDRHLTLQRTDIDELIPSKQSTMPEGLLMTFTRREILDLLAFLQQP